MSATLDATLDLKLEAVVIPVSDVDRAKQFYIVAAREQLVARGADVSEVFHAGAPGAQFDPGASSARLSGLSPDRSSYNSFATFTDPDGNLWLLQEVTTRLPGRV